MTNPHVWRETRGDPRIAVAGVNPHAGEYGAFGKEELKVLKPVVQKAVRNGWRVTGPHPPDTLFQWAAKGNCDAVLCMYHDQGLIPFKLYCPAAAPFWQPLIF